MRLLTEPILVGTRSFFNIVGRLDRICFERVRWVTDVLADDFYVDRIIEGWW